MAKRRFSKSRDFVGSTPTSANYVSWGFLENIMPELWEENYQPNPDYWNIISYLWGGFVEIVTFLALTIIVVIFVSLLSFIIAYLVALPFISS